MKRNPKKSEADEAKEREAEFVRQKIVKQIMDEFPATRVFTRGYLAIHYPKKRICDIRA